ncbi:MAG: DUF2975 domain-containing protein [Alphaproteobacteria bacterium]
MKALGKGSVASIVRVGLLIAWIVLWIAATALLIGALVSAGFFILLGVHAIKFDIDNASVFQYWPLVGFGFVIGAIVIGGSLIIVWRLRRLFANFVSGDPFHKSNADHLRAIWITLLVMEISRYALMIVIGAWLLTAHLPEDDDHHVSFHGADHGPDLSTWFVILILIVLAEVFREGARMREEQELTI